MAGRKVWLTDWLAHRKEKRQAGMNEVQWRGGG